VNYSCDAYPSNEQTGEISFFRCRKRELEKVTFDRFIVGSLLDDIGYFGSFKETRILVVPPLLEVAEFRKRTSSSSYFVTKFEKLFSDVTCDEPQTWSERVS